MKAALKFRADLGRDLVTPQGGIMNIKLQKIVDKIINVFCRIFKINYAVHHRLLSEEEAKALGLLELEKGQKVEKWIVEKPTEM